MLADSTTLYQNQLYGWIQHDLAACESKIAECEKEIVNCEAKIKEVEKYLKKMDTSADDLTYSRSKVKQLRDEEMLLLDEKTLLLDEKKLLRDEKKLLLELLEKEGNLRKARQLLGNQLLSKKYQSNGDHKPFKLRGHTFHPNSLSPFASPRKITKSCHRTCHLRMAI